MFLKSHLVSNTHQIVVLYYVADCFQIVGLGNRLRVLALDDFVTADVAAGTGGIDASIGFETHRPENVGVAFNDSLFVFAIFINAKVSSRYRTSVMEF